MVFLLLNQTSISHGHLNTKYGQFMGGANYFYPTLLSPYVFPILMNLPPFSFFTSVSPLITNC